MSLPGRLKRDREQAGCDAGVRPDTGDPALALIWSGQAPAFRQRGFGPVAQPDRATVS
jgi:hypothetical protein